MIQTIQEACMKMASLSIYKGILNRTSRKLFSACCKQAAAAMELNMAMHKPNFYRPGVIFLPCCANADSAASSRSA